MSHQERYQENKEIPLAEKLMALRAHIGELPELAMPNQAQVEQAVDAKYPELLVNEKSKLVEAFMKSEQDAADEADRRAEDIA